LETKNISPQLNKSRTLGVKEFQQFNLGLTEEPKRRNTKILSAIYVDNNNDSSVVHTPKLDKTIDG